MKTIGVIDARPGKRLVSFLMVLFILTLGIGIGTLISYRVGAVGPGDSQLRIQNDGKPIVGGAALALSQAFEEVSKRVEPAVVNINTEEVVKVTRGRSSRRGQQQQQPPQQQQNPRERDPLDDLFNRLPFFGNPDLPDQFTRRSLGSGVIVDPKGYIITNNHVVEGASKIKVSVQEGKEYTARVIATDQLSDIAGDDTPALSDTGALLDRLGARSGLGERHAVRALGRAVARRSARLIAAGLVGALWFIDRELTTPHTIGVDGSVYGGYPGFGNMVAGGFVELLGAARAARLRLAYAKDSTSAGAAVIAAARRW